MTARAPAILTPRSSSDNGDGPGGGGVNGDGAGGTGHGPYPDWIEALLHPTGDGGYVAPHPGGDSGGVAGKPAGDGGGFRGPSPMDAGVLIRGATGDTGAIRAYPGADGRILIPKINNDAGYAFTKPPGPDMGFVRAAVGPDTASPLYLTVDASGNVGADFSGHVHAAGLDLDSAVIATPANNNKVRWLAGTREVASLAGGDPSIGQHLLYLLAQAGPAGYLGSLLTLSAPGPAGQDTGIIALGANAAGSSDGNVDAIAGVHGTGPIPSTVRKTIIDGAGKSEFVQLLSSGGGTPLDKARLISGRTTLTFAGGDSRSNIATIAHGFGQAPTAIVALPRLTSAGQYCYAVQDHAPDATNFFLRTRETGGVAIANTVTQVIDWIAIG